MRRNKLFSRLGVTPGSVLCAAMLFVSFLCYFAAIWYVETYGQLGFDSILYTLTADLAGVESKLVLSFVKKAVVRAVFCTGIVWLFLVMPSFSLRLSSRRIVVWLGKSFHISLYPFRRWFAAALSVALSVAVLITAAIEAELPQFLYCIRNPSTFYEEKYTPPETVEIRFPEERRNLIYIFLESMEVSFASREEGGALKHNAIPELCRLTQENTSFSHSDGIGGPYSPSGTTWTTAAMVAQTAGIPLKVPVGVEREAFTEAEGNDLAGATAIYDILKENGYTQTLMLGSDARFGGGYQYVTRHGVDRVLDYNTAQEDGIIPQGYKVWWGFEDMRLFEYAKRELTRLASEEAPFAVTMMTIDTHQVSGYKCSLCQDEFAEQYENVYHCASKQVEQFVQWLKQQDFYENTTVVIVGDHPSMDAGYCTRNIDTDYDRRIYNCILNSAAASDHLKNREMSVFDLFPTTLAAMGCTIEGERLGLGTNLFSDRPTLMEEMGFEHFDDEVARYSDYYFSHFF